MEHPHVFSGRLVPTGASMAQLMRTYVRQQRHGTGVTGVLAIDARRRAEEGLANISSVLVPEDRYSASGGVHAIRELLASRRHNLIQGNWRDVQGWLVDRDHRSAIARLIRPLSAVPTDLHSVVTTALRRLSRHPVQPTVLQMLHTVEQVPNPASRVVLSQERDRLGSLRASLDWRPVAQDLETIAVAGAHHRRFPSRRRSRLRRQPIRRHEAAGVYRLLAPHGHHPHERRPAPRCRRRILPGARHRRTCSSPVAPSSPPAATRHRR